MRITSIRWVVGLALVTVTACGGGTGRANLTPGPMPDGGSFTGVWFSPQYGEMHMMQTGASVVAEYTKDERSGRIQGTATGNVLRFEWRERRELVSGVPQTLRGRGYFQYTVGDDGRHNILGEWGIDNNEVGGGPWNAYRLRNRRPSLNSDGGADTSGGEQPESFESDDSGGASFDSPSDTRSSGDGGGDLDLDSLDL